MSSPLFRLISTHFQEFSPVRRNAGLYALTLRGGRTVTIGFGQDADLRVSLENGWRQLDHLPHAVKAEAEFGVLTISEDHENFWYRRICFSPSSFSIRVTKENGEDRVVIARRKDGPVRKSAPSLYTLTTQDWGNLLDDPRASLRGIHWGREEQKYILLTAADSFLATVKDNDRRISDWTAPAYQALHSRGLIRAAAPVYASYEDYLKSAEWKALRAQVWARDNGKCVFCARPGQSVHHVVYPKIIGTESPTTLLTVCRRCHEILHGALAAAQRTEQGTHLPRIGGQVIP